MSGNSTMKPSEKQRELIGVDPMGVMKMLRISHPLNSIFLSFLAPIWPFLLRKIIKNRLHSQDVSCRLTTLSQILHEYSIPRIDLLKIDVEGAELDILEGIEDQHWPHILQIVMEVHDIQNRLDNIKTMLLDKGFKKVMTIQSDVSKILKLSTHNLYAVR